MKKIKLFTLGCKVNQYETQGIREKFLNAGFRENNSEKTDVYIINTCTVTRQADRESRHLIRKALKVNPEAKVIVTGCYVEKDADELLQISDRIQIIPNQQKHRIVDFLSLTRYKRLATSDRSFIPLSISEFHGHERAFVKIQDGCDNFCAYCKVPLVRGESRSRSLKEITKEVAGLVDRGFKEVVLTGICLGDYHYRNLGLADVVGSLAKIKAEFRIRLSSIEPQLISDKLIEKMASSAKICPHLHIPLQSGDNQILQKMNRRYTAKDYLSLIAKIKKKIKDIAITTDVLIGFPGESDRNFQCTVHCLEEISPLRTHIFSFSPREGTAAFNLAARIEPQIVKERVGLLKEVAQKSSHKFRKRFLGRKLTVLIESRADKESRTFCGYSENYIRVIVTGASAKDVNKLLPVKIKTVDIHSTKT
ncbi:MAG: tRNA (N(6)-L-threonylcarbamoyladenosine(37)-C(2))-methylthiotransferase MtaB [Omnitrophica bacterium]|nr:tRNA (N(6)-L-threonylcarbamoyladenosine(37)-C(2))-methylthiotransferase MtaB [Candidatus Omnitrophota bacterium]